MNYCQILLSFIYGVSVVTAGVAILEFIVGSRQSYLNRSIYLGEAFLFGSILLVGQMLILSFIGLYKGPFLWGVVLLNYSVLLNRKVRSQFGKQIMGKIRWDLPLLMLVFLMAVFVFRNCFFMVDVDDHRSYLFVQKLWLSEGTSLHGDVALSSMVFVPQFDSVPYSLGIAVFGKETLFSQMVNLSWRLIVLVLVFGYTSYRLNRYCGLAAAILVLFNDHFFYSGVNNSVIINSAVVAFVFAAAYNFWESRVRNCPVRFAFAIVFSIYLMANKYQMAYAFIFLLIFGFFIQANVFQKTKDIFKNKRLLWVVLMATFFASLWYVKNFLITGDPVFPIFAGRLNAFNWTVAQEMAYTKEVVGLPPSLILKYLNYLFIWPGINAAKYVIVVISLLPVFLISAGKKDQIEKDSVMELSFWLGLSLVLIIGTCLASCAEPRYYRYSIGVFGFSAVFALYYVFRYSFQIKKEFLISGIILLLSFPGYKIVFQQRGPLERPAIQDNINVLLNKLHFDDILDRYYPETRVAIESFSQNKEKTTESAWDFGMIGAKRLSFFLLPIRPHVGKWSTSVICWDSYKSEDLIIRDLKTYGIKWIMRVKEDDLIFLPVEDYAHELLTDERYNEKITSDYGLPNELTGRR